ncbi:phage tail tube protein [Bacteroides fragilis]|jgi:predicted secreted protein|uniref:Phage tail protein n=1 Tax=Bacteroides fragilis TaxID=817 RepID=A0A413JSF8_BACFG|nr:MULTISPECIES: phage tail tube protein [Bacteroides]MBY2893801.1 phage tail protein [Bacteroides fragilis]MCM0225433.1 phage tail protein [Bacteroides fragilis]MCM0361203.1 phage tail protein [Bacteroides fragilis]MCS2271542.1 phage tail protein [Bacteroides fragilis]MDV6156500.1 phage tail tube protein [Bacteroides hominis (ex Liu et al. 2022)]
MSKAKAVLGKDFMLFVGGKALALATSCKLSISAETIDTQSKDSGIWTEKDIKKLSWNGSSENLFSADKGISGYDTLFDLMLNCQPVEAKFGIPANADASEVPSDGWSLPAASYSGQVLITSLELNAPDGDKTTFSATFEGTGALSPRASDGPVEDPTA